MLLQLEKKARRAQSLSALYFLIVNETIHLVHYRQAFVWLKTSNKITAVSGVPNPDPNSLYMQWAGKLASKLQSRRPQSLDEIERSSLPEDLASEWDDYLPQSALWLPLIHPDGNEIGAVVFAKGSPWSEPDKILLAHLGETYAHALGFYLKTSGRIGTRIKAALRAEFFVPASLLILISLFFIPVKLTALGDAEVIARRPAIIRSPLEGVIDDVMIAPNEAVRKGQILVELDKRALTNRLLQAKKSLEVERVKLLKSKQLALRDRQFAGQLDVIEAIIEEQEAEITYLERLLNQARLKSPISGISIYNDRNDLIGRPVKIGEKLLAVAEKNDSHLVLWLATNDAIALTQGSRVRLFLNTSPHQPIEARLTNMSYTPVARPEGYMAYRVEADFADQNSAPRIGLRGVAKVYGEQTNLGYLLFRRPLITLRQWTGL